MRETQLVFNMIGALSWCLIAFPGIAVGGERPGGVDDSFFEAKIRPVLAETCFRCHGGQKVSGKLRVDSRQALLKGGDSGAALHPGDDTESLLIKAVRREEDVAAMPPDKPLRQDQVEALVAWVKAGAPWPEQTSSFKVEKHWAFEAIQKPAVPDVKDRKWCKTAIDAFVSSKWQGNKIVPATTANRRAWIRRATYDLTGLPPTSEEVLAFEQDRSTMAYERVIDRLLDTPAYGEQWGRHWLDVVRYADTAGENSDHPLPHAWRYRNWVIGAFNRDMPFNEFASEQIAGDLRAKANPKHASPDQIIATGYLAIARRFGHEIDKDMYLTYEDVIDNLGKTFLGLSLGCARCHDHKYDPVSNRDYYGLYGIFASTRFSYPGCEPSQQPRDLIPLDSWQADPASIKRKELLKHQEAEIKARTEGLAKQARLLMEECLKTEVILAQALVGEGQTRTLQSAASKPLDQVTVEQGDIIQLSISPRGNYGADTTKLELTLHECDGSKREWSLNQVVADFLGGNPTDPAKGRGASWCFLDERDGFTLLSESVGAIDGRRELKAWRRGENPAVFVNGSDQPVKVWTILSPRSVFVHPSPTGSVAVAWISPFSGRLSITGAVTDAHPAGLDGVSFQLRRFRVREAQSRFQDQAKSLASLISLEKQRAEIGLQARNQVAYAVAEGTPADSPIQKRGDPANRGEIVSRKAPDLLGGDRLRDPKQSGRAELAEWVTRASNPLTARVIVNRVWLWHFGRGLVTSPNDFGTRGAPPSHPELLDYLASEFVSHGWSIKWLHREIMRSATYQLSSDYEGSNRPAPDSFAVFPRRRMTAEELRDTILSVSGELDTTPGQAHPFPPESSWSFSQHAPFAAEYESSKRSVYVMQKRNRRSRFISLFDGPDPNSSTPLRESSIVPTQALYFLNDPWFHARANTLATRISKETSGVDQQVDALYEQLFNRHPTQEELAESREFRKSVSRESGREGLSCDDRTSLESLTRILMASNEFIFIE